MKHTKRTIIATFFVFLFSLPVAAAGLTATDDDTQIGTGSTGKPVVISLSKIRTTQPLAKSDEQLHETEEEEFRKEILLANPPKPSYLPSHSFHQEFGSHEKIRAAYAPVEPPSLIANFPGLPAIGRQQPDPIITAGPNHLLLAVNHTIGIYSKDGRKKFEATFDQWFAPLTNAAGARLFDPKLIYDQYKGHYIFMCNARRSDRRAWFLFSVSKTSNPEGEWAFWALDMQINGNDRSDLWADFPRIGMNKDAIYLSANMTAFGTFAFRYAKIRILRKDQIYAFDNLPWRDFWGMNDASGQRAINIEPAHSFTPSSDGYLISTLPAGGNLVTFWTIKNSTTTDPQLTKMKVPVSSYRMPPDAEQKGGGVKITTRDTGVYNAVVRNGVLYTALNTAHNWGSGLVCAIRYYRISLTGKLLQETTFGADQISYYFPVVMPDSRGNVILGFNRSGVNQFAGVYFSGSKKADPAKFSHSIEIRPGLANYKNTFARTDIGRWGDYNGIAYSSDNSIFIFSEFAEKPDAWFTWVGRVKFR